jgi:hypothetical protein
MRALSKLTAGGDPSRQRELAKAGEATSEDEPQGEFDGDGDGDGEMSA